MTRDNECRIRIVDVAIYTYKRVVCVCLSACLSVCFLSATRHLSTLRRCLRVAESRISRRRDRPRAPRGQACTARARARMPYNFSTKKSLRWCLSKTKPYARACCRIRNCRDFQKKGKKKTNMPLPKFSLQFAFSWSFYFSNRTESYLIFGRSRPWSARILYKVKRTCETRKVIKKCVRPDGLTKLRFYSLFCRPIKIHPVTKLLIKKTMSYLSYLWVFISLSLFISLFLYLYPSFYLSLSLSFHLSFFLSPSLSLFLSLPPPLSLFLSLSLSLPPPIETVTLTVHTDTQPIANQHCPL